jgi:L-alanine-DL-glutamate epimerase-like enolase superfamily enzyme
MANRRNFLKTVTALGAVGMCSQSPATAALNIPEDEKITIPDIKSLFPEPIIIRNIELLGFDKEYILRVTAENGATGFTLCNQRMPNLISLLHGLIIPLLIGKDARNIEELTDYVYVANSNYKYAGMPFWNCVGHVEIAILDLLGQIAKKPVNQLLGKPVKNELDVYLSSTTRETTPQQEADNFKKRIEETGAKAVKFKVGGRMSKNADAMPGRSDTIVPLMRKTLGNSITFYVDANGSYDLKNGIEMAHYLEDQQVDIFEEPVPFDEYENTKKITDVIKKMRLAGGEQDTSNYRFEWIAQNHALDVLQPDLFYNGGFLRCLKVAQIAQKAGLKFSPHSPKTDPQAAPMLHLMSLVPNSGGFQEWHISYPTHKSWYSPHYEIKNGKIAVPKGNGLGITFDETIWKKAEIIKC